MAKIKISELSIGDWVRYRDREWIVCSLYQFTEEVGLWRKDSQLCEYVADIEPIPLTPEILEKNGFVESSKYRWSNPSIGCACLRLGTKYWDIRINGRNRAYRPTRISIDNISHTHELQHALRLAGVGKEIEL